MAIYHCSIKNIGRSSGRSAVASAAYRAGEKLTDHETGIVSDYTRKGGVIYSEIMLPDHAPIEYKDRETLWNSVQEIEKSSDARLAREVEVALPTELSREQQIDVLHSYIKSNFVDEGMCADFAIHDKGDGNPHAHIMLTTRPIKNNGEWGSKEKKAYSLDENGEKIPVIDKKTGQQKIEKKTGRKVWQRETIEANDWNKREKIELWRESWAKECNRFLEKELQIDHRSYERQGIEKEPTIHEGYAAREIEKRGQVSERCELNRSIRQRNSLLDRIKAELSKIKEQLQSLFSEKEKITFEPVISYEVAENLNRAYGEKTRLEREYRSINEEQNSIQNRLYTKIVPELKELPIDGMEDVWSIRFFEARKDKFDLWNAAPEKKLIFGKTKSDLMADPEIEEVVTIYRSFKGNVPAPEVADKFEALYQEQQKLDTEIKELNSQMIGINNRLNSISEKIDRLNEQFLVYPDKTAQNGNMKPVEVDYIDYFPKDWTPEKIVHYAFDRDMAYDGDFEDRERYIEHCKKYAPTPENEARRAKERAEREKERAAAEKAAKEKANRPPDIREVLGNQGLRKFAEDWHRQHDDEVERQRKAPKKQKDRGWDLDL